MWMEDSKYLQLLMNGEYDVVIVDQRRNIMVKILTCGVYSVSNPSTKLGFMLRILKLYCWLRSRRMEHCSIYQVLETWRPRYDHTIVIHSLFCCSKMAAAVLWINQYSRCFSILRHLISRTGSVQGRCNIPEITFCLIDGQQVLLIQ